MYLISPVTSTGHGPRTNAFLQRHERDVDSLPLFKLLVRVILCIRRPFTACEVDDVQLTWLGACGLLAAAATATAAADVDDADAVRTG